MINYTEDPSVDTISYGIRWLVTHNPELLYYIGAREMEMELIDRLAKGKTKDEDPSIH